MGERPSHAWILDPQSAPLSKTAFGGKLGLEQDNFRMPNLDAGIFVSAEYFLPVSERVEL